MQLNPTRSQRLDPATLRLPLIALIDVVLFLLFYFVISYSVSAEEAELATGFAKPGVSASPLQPQVVLVSQAGEQAEFRIGTHLFVEQKALVDFLRTLPKEPGVVVKATPDVPVGATVAAVQAGKDAGFGDVRFAVTPGGASSDGGKP